MAAATTRHVPRIIAAPRMAAAMFCFRQISSSRLPGVRRSQILKPIMAITMPTSVKTTTDKTAMPKLSGRQCTGAGIGWVASKKETKLEEGGMAQSFPVKIIQPANPQIAVGGLGSHLVV